jgi:hypothetical protein
VTDGTKLKIVLVTTSGLGEANVVFLASAITVICAALVASWLMAHPPTMEGSPQ